MPYYQFHDESGEPWGSYEVFWDEPDQGRNFDSDGEPVEAGWYWAAGHPGCLWDGEPSGPFASEHAARLDADEYLPEG